MRIDHRLLWMGICLLAAVSPMLAPTSAHETQRGFPGWPKTYEGRPLQPLPLSVIEARFAENFPGRIGRFSDGQREIILRWVTSETRKLHPAADCFRGMGYAVQTLPMQRHSNGAHWGRFRAVRDQSALLVEERIVDAEGRQWTDVSAWYWAALWGDTQGPWWAITFARQETPAENSNQTYDGRQKDFRHDHRLLPELMPGASRPEAGTPRQGSRLQSALIERIPGRQASAFDFTAAKAGIGKQQGTQ